MKIRIPKKRNEIKVKFEVKSLTSRGGLISSWRDNLKGRSKELRNRAGICTLRIKDGSLFNNL